MATWNLLLTVLTILQYVFIDTNGTVSCSCKSFKCGEYNSKSNVNEYSECVNANNDYSGLTSCEHCERCSQHTCSCRSKTRCAKDVRITIGCAVVPVLLLCGVCICFCFSHDIIKCPSCPSEDECIIKCCVYDTLDTKDTDSELQNNDGANEGNIGKQQLTKTTQMRDNIEMTESEHWSMLCNPEI
eukprot:122657_1